jgi:hypothetical protein
MGFAPLNPSYGLQDQYDIAVVERKSGADIMRRVRRDSVGWAKARSAVPTRVI